MGRSKRFSPPSKGNHYNTGAGKRLLSRAVFRSNIRLAFQPALFNS